MLEVNDLRVAYGGIQAVRGISFHVNEGEMVALIGANGAGKTSTLKALSRLLDLAGGSVRYRGKEIFGLPPHELVGEGIALVPEGRGVFPRMNIVENLLMGAYSRRDKAGIEADMAHVFSLLPRLNERAQQLAGTIQGIVCQTLCKRQNERGRVVAAEVLVATPAIRNLIREGKTHQIYSAMQAGAQFGMQTLDQHLAELVRTNAISFDEGMEKCQHLEDFMRLTGRTR